MGGECVGVFRIWDTELPLKEPGYLVPLFMYHGRCDVRGRLARKLRDELAEVCFVDLKPPAL